MRSDSAVSGFASAAVKETLMGARSVALDMITNVDCITLDDYCAKNAVDRVHLLKIDVEGLEMPVLQGARRMLSEKRIDVILYEFGTHQMARREYFRDFWNFFSEVGYKSFRMRPNGWPPAAIEKYHTSFEDFTKVYGLLATKG